MPPPIAKTQNNTRIVHLHVFVEMHRLIVDVVLHEEVVDTTQESHLGQGEYVHELFHGVAVGALQSSHLHHYIQSSLLYHRYNRETTITFP